MSGARGADMTCAWHGYLVLCGRLDLSSRAGHLCGCSHWGREGRPFQRQRKRFVLLIMLCFWEGGAFIPFLRPRCLLYLEAILGGGTTQAFRSYSPQK